MSGTEDRRAPGATRIPFDALVEVTRGGLVPAAIVARELDVRMIETVCIASYHDYKTQGGLAVRNDGFLPDGAVL